MYRPLSVVYDHDFDPNLTSDPNATADFPANAFQCNQSIEIFAQFIEQHDYFFFIQMALNVVNAIVNAYGHFVILRRQDRRPALSFLLRGLSLCEVFFNLSFFLRALLSYCLMSNRLVVLEPTPLKLDLIAWLYVSVATLSVSAILMRNWTVVTIACFRMIAVARPVKFYRVFSRRVVTPVYVVLLFCALLVAMPRLFDYELVYCMAFKSFVWKRTVLLKLKAYKLFYMNVVLFIFQNGGPVLTVALASTITARYIYVQQQRRPGKKMNAVPTQAEDAPTGNNGHRTSVVRRPSKAHSKTERRKGCADRTVILLSVLFFIFEMPSFVNKLFSLFTINIKVDYIVIQVANLMVCIESFCNFIVYLVSNGTINIPTPQACFRGDNCVCSRVCHKKRDAAMNNNNSTQCRTFLAPLKEAEADKEQLSLILVGNDTAI